MGGGDKSKAPAKRGRGRPKFVVDYNVVKKLAAIMATDREIAVFLGCDERTVKRLKKTEEWKRTIESGRTHFKLSLRRNIIKMAETNIAMAIFLSKAHLGLSDNGSVSSNDPISEIKITVKRPAKRTSTQST